MTKKWTALLLAAVLAVGLSACDTSRAEAPGSNLESGVSAIEDAMTKRNETESSSFPAGSDLRIGTSDDTIATPDDFPAAYNYDTGKIEDYSRTAMLQKMPEPVDNATVLNTSADPNHIQALYLWEEGNVPAKTQFTAAMTGYFDNWDFRPYVTAIPRPHRSTTERCCGVDGRRCVSVPWKLYRFSAHGSGSTGAGLPDLHRRLPSVALHAGGRRAGCSAGCPLLCGRMRMFTGIDPDDIAVMGFFRRRHSGGRISDALR